MVGLGDLPGNQFASEALGVSSDGTVIVGQGVGTKGKEAFRWTSDTGMVGLGYLPEGTYESTAFGVSGNGEIVVGESRYNFLTDNKEAFRWTAAGGMDGLGDLPGGRQTSTARAISQNGAVIVGTSASATAEIEAFVWTASGGMRGLGLLSGGTRSAALAVSGDGSVIVGTANNESYYGSDQAMIWTASNGMQLLMDYLVARGVTGLEGWRLDQANAISADGQTIGGFGYTPDSYIGSFVVNLQAVPAPSTVWLLGTALTGLGWRRYRRRKAAS